jgi:hypothetical protein
MTAASKTPKRDLNGSTVIKIDKSVLRFGEVRHRDKSQSGAQMVTPLRKTVRARNKSHLIFVAAQPCLICQRSPCDAHHLKFAQPRALGRKVSDEFTVPLCRDHHQELHRHGNEMAWWANIKLEPLETAKSLWEATLAGRDSVNGLASINAEQGSGR